MVGPGGAEQVTADGAIGTSGQPCRVWAINVLCDNVGTGEVVFRNGTADTDDIWLREQAAQNTGTTFTYGKKGLFFPDGCFYDHGANIVSVTVQFSEEK